VQERVLDPIGMSRSTFDAAAVANDADHATPHGTALDGSYQPVSIADEAAWSGPDAPSGGMWSSANELARYVMTQLRHGVAPDGTRVISEANLNETWEPQVAISADISYGLGWEIESWRGLRIIRHGGNTRGFTSDVAFLPDSDLGVVVLANAQEANAAVPAIRQRLIELLYDQPNEAEPQLVAAQDELAQQRTATAAALGDPIDPHLAHSLTGDYYNVDLGAVTVTYEKGALVADAGELRVALQPLRDPPASGPSFVATNPPWAGQPVRFDVGGSSPRLVYGAPPEEYVFDRLTEPATPVASPTG
jgi:hypothetical protein